MPFNKHSDFGLSTVNLRRTHPSISDQALGEALPQNALVQVAPDEDHSAPVALARFPGLARGPVKHRMHALW